MVTAKETLPLDAQVEALLDKLAREAGHLLYTTSPYGPGRGLGIKAQKGLQQPDFSALIDKRDDYEKDSDYEVHAQFGQPLFGKFSPPPFTGAGRQVIMRTVPNPIRDILGYETQTETETEWDETGWGPFKKRVPRYTHKTNKIPVYSEPRAIKAGELTKAPSDEPAVRVYWGAFIANPKICGDNRGGKYVLYTLIAPKTSATALWDAAKEDPAVIQNLALRVFPLELELLLEGADLNPNIHKAETLKEAAQFWVDVGVEPYRLPDDLRDAYGGKEYT